MDDAVEVPPVGLHAIVGDVDDDVAVALQLHELHVAVLPVEDPGGQPGRDGTARNEDAGEAGRRHAGADELGAHRQIGRPRRVDVAAQHHGVGTGGRQPLVEPVPLGGVAVPLARVDEPPRHQADRRNDDLAPDHPPTGGRRRQLSRQPLLLRRPEERPAAVPVADADHHPVTPVHRPVPPDQAGVEHDQVDEVAPVQRAVHPVALTRPPHRHPLPVGPDRRRPARRPGPVPAVVVMGGAFPPAARRHLVVVPHRHHRVAGVERLQVGIGLVLGVAGPVVGQRGGGGARLMRTHLGSGVPVVLVDVVADVDHQVDVTAGEVAVGVEPPGRQGGAGHKAEAQAGHRLAERRGGPRAPYRGVGAVRVNAGTSEPVPVGRGRLELAHVDVQGVVDVGPGLRRALGHDVGEPRVPGHLPPDVHRGSGGRGAAGRRGPPGPQDHAVGEGVAAGDAVPEGAGVRGAGQGRGSLWSGLPRFF